MDSDNGLDLSLSLPCGGPTSGVKGKTATGSETEADRGSKLIDDFKNFLDGSNHKEESTVGPPRNTQSKPDENLFYDLSKGPTNLEDKRQETSNKRKNMFDEINNQNDDVADSETEGSTSKQGNKEARVSDVDLKSQSQRRLAEFKSGSVSLSANVLNMPYSLSVKESNTIPMSQTIPVNQQPVIPANLPAMFGGGGGYSSVVVPTVEGGKSEGVVSHSLQYHGSYFNRGPQNSTMQNDGLKIIQAASPVTTPMSYERAKGDSKQAKEEGSSSMHTETDTKGNNVIDQSKPENFPPEYPAIRPGILADLKFGGSGSSPNLPWVSTTGQGPNGKTISGVTYRYSGTQIRIVCACHGSHMSPEEFVQHANEEQPTLNGGGLVAFSNSNPATSAQN